MKKIFIVSTVSALFMCACVMDRIDRIQMVNNSNTGLIFFYNCLDSIGYGRDTLTVNPYFRQFDHFKSDIVDKNLYIAQDSSKVVGIPFPKERLTSTCGDGHIRFFFIKDSVFFTNPWDTIVQYQMYERKLVFSKEDLERMNWTITYE